MEYPHFVEYSHFVDIICILWMYPNFVDNIRIGHITSYLAQNVCHVLHSSVMVVDIICIGRSLHSFVVIVDIICICHIMSYLDCNIHPIFHIYSSSVIYWCRRHQQMGHTPDN